MKKLSFLTACLLAAAILAGCGGGKKKNASQAEMTVAADTVWIDDYIGTLPAADGPGIDTDLQLQWSKAEGVDNTYVLTEQYIDGGTKNRKGRFNVERGVAEDPDATVIVLDWDKPVEQQRYYMWYSDSPEVLHVLNPSRELVKNTQLNYTLKHVKRTVEEGE